MLSLSVGKLYHFIELIGVGIIMSTVSETIVPSNDAFGRVRAFAKARWKAAMLVLIIAAAAVAGSLWWRTKGDAAEYTTGKVSRGSVQVEVSATGTVQAVTT